MTDQTIAMLIHQQRIELALEITFAAVMLAATILDAVVVIQQLRHRSNYGVATAFIGAVVLTIACGSVRDGIVATHRSARERALAEYERTFSSDLADEVSRIEDHRETRERR